MGRRKKAKDKNVFIIDEDDLEVYSGDVERYEVSVGPPVVKGRKLKPLHTATGGEGENPADAGVSTGQGRSTIQQSPHMASGANPQQIFKLEDDLTRTRDVVEDLKHNVSVLEGEVKDLRGEMERISYLLRSLEGLRNAMKDIESTVSELSGLYDLISANVNPFIEMPPLRRRDEIVKEAGGGTEGDPGEEFQELTEIFEEEEEPFEEEWETPVADLESEEWVLKWTHFLLEEVGKAGLEDALNYYINLGWIDDPLLEKVKEIARGTRVPLKNREGRKKGSWKMNMDDHIKSLEYLKRIKGERR